MSDSVRPHRRQPIRLLRPWDSPGKNIGVGCHFLLQMLFWTWPNPTVSWSSNGHLTCPGYQHLIVYHTFSSLKCLFHLHQGHHILMGFYLFYLFYPESFAISCLYFRLLITVVPKSGGGGEHVTRNESSFLEPKIALNWQQQNGAFKPTVARNWILPMVLQGLQADPSTESW